MIFNRVLTNKSGNFSALIGECPNVTVFQTEKGLFNAKFDQICPKIATFDLFSPFKIPPKKNY